MATRADQDRYQEEEHHVVQDIKSIEALVVQLHADDEDEAAVAREEEVRSHVVGHHYGRDSWVVEAEELRELEQEDGLADSSDAVEDHEGEYYARTFSVPDEAIAKEEEDQVYPERGSKD